METSQLKLLLPSYHKKARNTRTGTACQKKSVSDAEVYGFELHQSLPCVRGGVKNLFDF
jgi:hypothetical protein